MSHACPSFEVEIAGLFEGGAVVVIPSQKEEYFNLFVGSLGPRGRSDVCKHAFSALKVGTRLEVTCQDPEHHTCHKGPDGAMRPNVSVWLAHAAKSTDDAEATAQSAKAWDKSGGGTATVFEVRESFLLCQVSYKGKTFIGLWHKSKMPANFRFEDLKAGAALPKLRLVEPPTTKGTRAVIRFKPAS